MRTSVTISSRYCGPATSGNGGYTSGVLARGLAGRGPVEVTLRKPPPLDSPLQVEGDGALQLLDGSELIAEARPAPLDLEIPKPPSFDEARTLSAAYIGHHHHHYPTCFVCGPARGPGDGLRIFPGSDSSGSFVAAPWVPEPSVADAQGMVLPEILWASLDCAGYFGAAAPDFPPALLGRITAEVENTVREGERCVVLGWGLGTEGRKIHAATALFGEDGRLRGRSRQTWIRV
jgi:hypothetical protein